MGRIFQRSGLLPESVAVFTLEHNLRNSRPICESQDFQTIMRPILGALLADGQTRPTADDQVDV